MANPKNNGGRPSNKQRVARTRNWNKRRIAASLGHINNIIIDPTTSFLNHLLLDSVARSLQTILRNWDDDTKAVINNTHNSNEEESE